MRIQQQITILLYFGSLYVWIHISGLECYIYKHIKCKIYVKHFTDHLFYFDIHDVKQLMWTNDFYPMNQKVDMIPVWYADLYQNECRNLHLYSMWIFPRLYYCYILRSIKSQAQCAEVCNDEGDKNMSWHKKDKQC